MQRRPENTTHRLAGKECIQLRVMVLLNHSNRGCYAVALGLPHYLRLESSAEVDLYFPDMFSSLVSLCCMPLADH
jgi:hypothetical protein